MAHQTIHPRILYFGTPVVILSTMNPDGTPNLAPMSSAWWLGQHSMLGLSTRGQTWANLMRTRECVLNLPSVAQVDGVDRLALTTGRDPVPDYKVRMGVALVRDKFARAGWTPQPSELVSPPRVLECPVQLEAEVVAMHVLGTGDGTLGAIEVRMRRVHVDEALLVDGSPNHIDPDKWRPLIMSFCEFYGVGDRVHDSRLAAAFPGAAPRRPAA